MVKLNDAGGVAVGSTPAQKVYLGGNLIWAAEQQAAIEIPAPVAPLFAAQEVGAVYDPQQTGTLWQDVAATVPVAASGDPVARMDDISGNGLHALQPTASKRPVFRTDGMSNWIEPDGVDDELVAAFPAGDFYHFEAVSAFGSWDASVANYAVAGAYRVLGAAIADGSDSFNARAISQIVIVATELATGPAQDLLVHLDSVAKARASRPISANYLFNYEYRLRDADLSGWDMGGVETFEYCFLGCRQYDAPVFSVTSSAISLEGIFYDCRGFNQSVNHWDTSAVSNFTDVFSRARVFNQSLSNWDFSNATEVYGFLYSARSFNQSLTNFSVTGIVDLRNVFRSCYAFDQPLAHLDVSAAEKMDYMFSGATAFNQDISGWNVGSLKSIDGFFSGASAFNQDLSGWDVSNVTSSKNYDNGADAWLPVNKPVFV